jgi:hypothetical protein
VRRTAASRDCEAFDGGHQVRGERLPDLGAGLAPGADQREHAVGAVLGLEQGDGQVPVRIAGDGAAGEGLPHRADARLGGHHGLVGAAADRADGEHALLGVEGGHERQARPDQVLGHREVALDGVGRRAGEGDRRGELEQHLRGDGLQGLLRGPPGLARDAALGVVGLGTHEREIV